MGKKLGSAPPEAALTADGIRGAYVVTDENLLKGDPHRSDSGVAEPIKGVIDGTDIPVDFYPMPGGKDGVVLVEVEGDAAENQSGKPDEPPKPKPGDPDYDWAPLYDTDDLYKHTFPDGTVVTVKSFAAIYSKTWLYKVRDLETNVDVEFAAIDRAACPVARAVLMSLDETANGGDPIETFYDAWVKAGTSLGDGDEGLTPGE